MAKDRTNWDRCNTLIADARRRMKALDEERKFLLGRIKSLIEERGEDPDQLEMFEVAKDGQEEV